MTKSVGHSGRVHPLGSGGERFPMGVHSAGAGSGPEFEAGPARRTYWRAYVDFGAALTVLIGATSLLYMVSTGQRPHRHLLYALVAGAVALSGAVVLIGHKVVGTSRQLPFLLIWSASSLAFVIAAAALDGGIYSELLWLLVLPVVYAGIAYPLPIVRWIVTVAQASVLGLMVIGRDWTGTAWYRFGFVACVNALIIAAATNRHTFESGEREMTAIATHDGLTGCLNRGAFLDRVDAECERSQRYRRPVSVLIVDVDRFKNINDTLGHQAGDEALRGVAVSILATVRATDSVGRIGGDEFAVLFPEAGVDQAAAFGERLTAAARCAPTPIPLTISVGVATWAEPSDDPAALIARADSALYRAKVLGRDRVVTAQPPT